MNQSMYTVKSLSPRQKPAWTKANTYDEATAKATELKRNGHINIRIFGNVEAIVTKHVSEKELVMT